MNKREIKNSNKIEKIAVIERNNVKNQDRLSENLYRNKIMGVELQGKQNKK